VTDAPTQEDIEAQRDEGEMSKEEYEARREELQWRYQFYILNPARQPGVEYTFHVQEGGFEYPVMSSNTGGFTTFNSRHKSVGNGIRPTKEFLSLVGFGFHEAMCFMPDIYFRDDHFDRRVQSIYDGKPREYEVWAAQVLIHEFVAGDMLAPEIEPLAEWAGTHTEFGVPVLGEPHPESIDEDGGGESDV
jgi:hypothetical protein